MQLKIILNRVLRHSAFVYVAKRLVETLAGPIVEALPWAVGKHRLTSAYASLLARWAKRLSWKEVAKKPGQAVHVLDRFHIMSHVSKATEEVRAGELKAGGYERVLKDSRWLLLKHPENLTLETGDPPGRAAAIQPQERSALCAQAGLSVLLKDRRSDRLCLTIPPFRAPGQGPAERRANRERDVAGTIGVKKVLGSGSLGREGADDTRQAAGSAGAFEAPLTGIC